MLTETELVIAAGKSAKALAVRLEQLRVDRVVLAESCTAGLVAALLGQVPGISHWLCGSAVTYRESTKVAWLGVSRQTLEQQTAESLATTSEMAIGILQKTEEATCAAAVTGHLGPNAPPEIDGTVFITVVKRIGSSIEITRSTTCQLKAITRVGRQHEAAKAVLDLLLSDLS